MTTNQDDGDYAHDIAKQHKTGAMAYGISVEGITDYQQFCQWHDANDLRVYPSKQDWEWVKRKVQDDDEWDEQEYINPFVQASGIEE